MKQYLMDLTERAVMTFVQAFAAVFVVSDLSSVRAAAVAGIAAVLSLAKSVAARAIGNQDSAAFLPAP